MGSIRSRQGLLFFDFRYQGTRCREQTLLKDTPGNRERLQVFMEKIDREIKKGTFEYEKYFPGSRKVDQLAASQADRPKPIVNKSGAPMFLDFVDEWYLENEVSWKISYQKTVKGNIEKHLRPAFGEIEVSRITKGDILKFRSSLAKGPNGTKELSPSRVNHIMTTLRMILNDAADRFQFNTPFVGIKPLKVPPTDVDPFTIEEINLFLSRIRPDFYDYYSTRFFSALRTGEIDGMQWQYVDFDRRLMLIRKALVEGRLETPKTPGSIRDVYMSGPVFDAMKRQWNVTGHLGKFVFCNRNGEALDHRNITKRIWYPTLKLLNIKPRRPYQTRHTTATLWLAAGENPEWIARQMGHTSTEMLFTVYSRFVPNLTRNDGSAFENLLNSRMNGGSYDK